jgi:raffinose/stachyose/melibiose transport system substrate-binding protein
MSTPAPRPTRRALLRLGGATTSLWLLAACGSAPPTPAPAPVTAADAAKPAGPAAPTTAAPVGATKPPDTKPAAAPPAAPGAKREVHWWAGSATPTADAAVKRLVELFEAKHPNMTVKFVLQPDMAAMIQTALASGSGPDFAQGVYAPGERQVLADAKLILKLDDHYKERNWPVMPWARKRMSYKGGTWGIPHEAEYIAVWYNKAVLNKAGVAVPKTYDELLQASRTVKDKLGIVPWGFANNAGLNGNWWMSAMVEAVVGSEGFEKIIFGDARWDQPGMLEVADRFAGYFKDGLASKDGNAHDSNRVTAAFATDKHAFWATGTWNIVRFEDAKKKDTPNLDYDYFVLPNITPSLQPRPVGGHGAGYFVSARSRDLEATLAWADHFLSREAAKVFVEQLAHVPCTTTVTPGEYNVPPITRRLLETVLSPAGMGYNVTGTQPLKVREQWVQGNQGLAAGDLAPKDFVARLQKLWEEARAEGKLWEA